MMVTPLEAMELIIYLKEQKLWDTELKDKFTATVTQYRLDHQVGNGKRSYLRRTYTCPFFNHRELGCPLPLEVKPYGCLAFNSHHAEKKAGPECYSEISLLEKREAKFPGEEALNLALKEKFNIFWDKSPLPKALLDLWALEFSAADLSLS